MDTTVTAKMKILKPVKEIFEALADPDKIGFFWFSTSSDRWAQGESIKMTYDEYGAEGTIHIVEMVADQKIVFIWGA